MQTIKLWLVVSDLKKMFNLSLKEVKITKS